MYIYIGTVGRKLWEGYPYSIQLKRSSGLSRLSKLELDMAIDSHGLTASHKYD